MDTKNWTVKFSVHYPAITRKETEECAKALAVHLKIPCFAEREWDNSALITLEGHIQFYPKENIISIVRFITINDFLYLRDRNTKFMDHLGNSLLEDLTQFIHKELRKKLGWSDE